MDDQSASSEQLREVFIYFFIFTKRGPPFGRYVRGSCHTNMHLWQQEDKFAQDFFNNITEQYKRGEATLLLPTETVHNCSV